MPGSGARFEGRDFKKPALISDAVMGTPEAASQFVIIHRAEQPDFARRPAARWRGQMNAPVFAQGDDFLDGATEAPGEDGVGRFAELFQFGYCPRFAPACSRDTHVSNHFRIHRRAFGG